MRSKKGIEIIGATIVGVTILILGFIFTMALYNKAASKVESKSAEKVCEASNAARLVATLDVGVTEITTPRACKTLDKELPEEGYPQTTDGVMANIRDLMARCWKMWQEGRGKEVLGARGSLTASTANCFTCYTFSIKNLNDVKSFDANVFDLSLDKTAYFAEDQSDKCLAGGGGYCMDECKDPYTRESRASSKCKAQGKKCCRAQSLKNTCLDRGGQCLEKCAEGTVVYSDPLWGCANKNLKCCIKREQYFTYRDYIQKHGTPAFVVIQPDITFKPVEEVYEVVYVDSINPDFWSIGFKQTFRLILGEDITELPGLIAGQLNFYDCTKVYGTTGD